MNKLYNHYVSVVRNGKLVNWTGRNPDKFPEDKKKALDIAAHYRARGSCAYAVEIKEIIEE